MPLLDEETILVTMERLKDEEGRRLFPYLDTQKKWTLGFGRNLSDKGISPDEALLLLSNDVSDSCDALEKYIPWINNLSQARKSVLVDMCFQLGIHGLLEFKQMLAAAEIGNYREAARQMRLSLWYNQARNRVSKLMKIMETNQL